MIHKYLLKILSLILFCSSLGYSAPRVSILGGNNPITNNQQLGQTITIQRVLLNANNISAFFDNTGIFDQNTGLNNSPGFEWPKGNGTYANFTAGLSIACYINNELAQVMASYAGEYTPGYTQFVGGEFKGYTDNTFKIYSIKAGDNANNNPDYANWGLMVPFGAPYVDVNENGQYDPDLDIPGQRDAAQTLFLAMTDAFPEQRNATEGFGGGVTSNLLFADVRMTAWAYDSPGLEDIQFVRWVVINNGDRDWEKTYISVVVDPDIGYAGDDYIGCDTNLNLGYAYNGSPSDGPNGVNSYGSQPPAFGMDYFTSPVIRATGDTLGLTSYVFFTNTGSSPPPCESDPNGEPLGAYYMMTGVKKDQSPFLDPTNNNAPTRFVYPGDPETQSGWTEYQGSVQNCGGTTGTTVAVNPVGDRRFIFNSGSDDFLMVHGDTQEIVVAKLVALGSTNRASVTALKGLSVTAQLIFDNDFNVTPPPPRPIVSVDVIPKVSGTCDLRLFWEPNAESYFYWDTLFFPAEDTNYYRFQGYEVYEVNKNAITLPDFTKPASINNDVRLLYSFDLIDNIGLVYDTFATGNGEYAPFPIVPPYKMPVPAGFPNSGLTRSVTITSTAFPENYGGNTNLIYGQEYAYMVIAYAVSNYNNEPAGAPGNVMKRGFKVIRNSLSSSVIRFKPIAPPAGTEYTYRDGDTLTTNHRDAVVAPVILGKNDLINAKYKVLYTGPSNNLRYNLLKSLDDGQNFDTLYTGLRPNMDDSSRAQNDNQIVNGVLINVQRSLFTGVIRDLISTSSVIGTQSQKNGWDYSPSNNRNLRGALPFRAGPYQSVGMGLVWPSQGFYTNQASTVRDTSLLPVEIEFTGGAGQRAYRFKADTTQAAYDNFYLFDQMIDIPFRAYEVNTSTGTRRQLNVAIVNSMDTSATPRMQFGFNPTADSLGGKVFVYVFKSDYSPNEDPFYTTKNLFITVNSVDVSYVWAPRLINAGSPAYSVGDKMTIYPYTVSRAGTFYEFETVSPVFGSTQIASSRDDLEKIRVVPNPYYGFSALDRSQTDKFVTFRNLPAVCTIKIYTLNGDLIKTLNKEVTGNIATSSTMEWNMTNQDNSPIASGIYIALIDAPGIGQKVEKIVVFTAQERVNF